MKYQQTIKFSLMALAAVVFSAGTAYASIHIDGGNGTTGPNSENVNTVEYSSESEVEISNHADADNEFEVGVETGDNNFHENTVIDDIDTGDIDGDISIQTALNNGDIDLGDLWGDMGLAMVDFENDLTGPESVNTNLVSLEYERSVEINNRADIDNDLELRANTGDNHISHNTEVGDFKGGSIDFSGSVKNEANYGMGDISLGSSASSASVDLTNHLTGPNSENSNTVAVESETSLEVSNHADIDNDLEVHANTGDNSVGHNTVVGDISTGDISITYTLVNKAN